MPDHPYHDNEAGVESCTCMRCEGYRLGSQDAQREAAAEAQADTERLDWLDENGGEIHHYTGSWAWAGDPDYHTGRTLREAIDMARARAKEERKG